MNKAFIVIGILIITGGTIHYLEYWSLLGVLVMKIGLGMNVKGATVFSHALINVGGKKALLVATSSMLAKRHVIDLMSKYFKDHSIERYKSNINSVAKIKYNMAMKSSGINKIKSIGTLLLGVPILYFIWTKVLVSFLQKFVYALIYPIALTIWSFLVNSLGIVSTFITFIFQVVILNFGLNLLEKFSFGRKIVSWISGLSSFLGDIFHYINRLFIYLGFDPKHYMVIKSINFNRWLENIIDKKLNKRDRILARRDRRINAYEDILEVRKERVKNKIAKKKERSALQKIKEVYKRKILKEIHWKEVRKNREEDRKKRRLSTKR